MSDRFTEVLDELKALHAQKSQDYGGVGDPYANVRASEAWAIPAWVGAMIRACDKVKRLQSFAANGHLANEGVEDAFKDLAVYAIIGLVLYEEARDATHIQLARRAAAGRANSSTWDSPSRLGNAEGSDSIPDATGN